MSDPSRETRRRWMNNAWRYGTWPWRWMSLHAARRRGTVPVGILYYHRVADVDPNPWTIGNHGFKQQLDWLQKRFEIVSLEEAQRRIRSGTNLVPTICITFDDGYADNASFALPLLIQRGVPFTYFVTTSHIRTGNPFEHDVRRGCPLIPNSAETLRAMVDAGVEIGGHTRNHMDLGGIDDPAVLFDEVVTATREMEQLVGQPIRYFAFPFGQLENLNAQVFTLAREHGFAGVCSAYGGWNEIGGDGFHLQRFHGDPEFACVRNWLTLDPRRRRVWQSPYVEKMLHDESASGRRGFAPTVPPVSPGCPLADPAIHPAEPTP